MKCNQYETRLALYVEGDLTPSKSRDVEAHLQTCSSCRRFLEALRESQSMVKSLAGETLDASSFNTVAQRVKEQLSRQKTGRSWLVAASELWHWRPLWAAGFALLFLVGFLSLWRFLQTPAGSRQSGDTASTSGRSVQPKPSLDLDTGKTETDASETARHQAAAVAKKPPVLRMRIHRVPQPVEPTPSTPDVESEAQPPQELDQGAILEPEIPPPVDVQPEEPAPLVVKLVTDDPNIVIIWLIDQNVYPEEEPK
jgi:anti-sigma factor RsiW